jgi:hypothetical protein
MHKYTRSILGNPSQQRKKTQPILFDPKEPLPSSPKPPLTVSTADSIQFFPESYIELSLKDSIVVSQIHSTKNSPFISPKESLENSPNLSPKESLENFHVWSTSPKFSFLSPKKELLEIPLEEEDPFKTYINPLPPENSQLILDYLAMAGKIPQQQPPPPPPPRVFNKLLLDMPL